MRGVFNKLGAHEKCAWTEKYNQFLDQIRKLEKTNKSSPNDADITCLRTLREEICTLLHASFDHHIKRLKVYYIHTAHELNVRNCTDIANCFQNFYATLYNLNTTTATPLESLPPPPTTAHPYGWTTSRPQCPLLSQKFQIHYLYTKPWWLL